MSGVTLRRAAAEMRQDEDDPCWLTVADLLDVWVDHRLLESGGTLPQERAAILAVANAYLGETP